MSQTRVIALLTLIHVLWAGVNKAIEFGTGWLSPTMMAATRWTIVSLIFLGLFQLPWFRKLTRAAWPKTRDRWRAGLIGAALFGPCHAMYYWALSQGKATPAEGTVLLTSVPLWTGLIGWMVLKQRMSPVRWLAVALGLVGSYLTVFGFTFPQLGAEGSIGRLVFLTAVVIETIAFAFLVQIARRSSGVGAFACQTMGAAVGLWILGSALPAVFPLAVGAFTGASLAGFLYITLVAGIFCFTVYMGLTEHQELSFLALALLLQPPLSALLDWLTGRPILPQTIVGTAVVSIALLISVWGETRPSTAT